MYSKIIISFGITLDVHVCASCHVMACCTNSWSVWELPPSCGWQGCIPDLGRQHPPWVLLLGARTSRRYSAASSALPWSSRSLQLKSEEDLSKQHEHKTPFNITHIQHRKSDTHRIQHFEWYSWVYAPKHNAIQHFFFFFLHITQNY